MAGVVTNDPPVIAEKDAVVYDDALEIKRKVFAGQPVPPDLVEAYGAEAGKSESKKPAAAKADAKAGKSE